MSLEELEVLARQSQESIKIRSKPPTDPNRLQTLEAYLGRRIRRLVTHFRDKQGSPIIVAHLGGSDNVAISPLNQIEGVAAFCIDIDPYYDPAFGSKERIIRADLNNMPEISDNTFHYMFSYNALGYTNPAQSLREVYRTMRPSGIVDLYIEFWVSQFLSDIADLPFTQEITVKSPGQGWKMPLVAFLQTEHPSTVGNTSRLELVKR